MFISLQAPQFPNTQKPWDCWGKWQAQLQFLNRFAIQRMSVKFVAVWASYWTCEVTWSDNLEEKILAMMTLSYPNCGF